MDSSFLQYLARVESVARIRYIDFEDKVVAKVTPDVKLSRLAWSAEMGISALVVLEQSEKLRKQYVSGGISRVRETLRVAIKADIARTASVFHDLTAEHRRRAAVTTLDAIDRQQLE